jgi:hypothetical protein
MTAETAGEVFAEWMDSDSGLVAVRRRPGFQLGNNETVKRRNVENEGSHPMI